LNIKIIKMNKYLHYLLLLVISIAICHQTAGQEEDESMLNLLSEEEEIEYATASFKTNRVINLHSLESTAYGVMDFKIGHRFGTINGGAYDLFGLDNATMRLGFDYGINDKLTVGIGRSNFEKTYDAMIKYKFLRQSTGKTNMPISAGILFTNAIKTVTIVDPNIPDDFASRLYYTGQLIIGRKFSDAFSLQMSPTWIRRNYAPTNEENNVYALGVGTRLKLTKRIAITGEYIYLLPDQVGSNINNSLSLGFDIETGGHVFQLHFTNSTSMIEKGFIAETTNSWTDGGIHFGFNVSRVFTLKEKK
jgi:hypothetical protein